jgi:hypothetical protein
MLKQHLESTADAANYREAMISVANLLKIDADAIIKLRAVQPAFWRFTPELIKSVIPNVPNALAALLCERRTMR